VLDLACGRGRHAIAAAEAGLTSVGLDRDAARLAELASLARARRLPLDAVRTDLETPHGIPVKPGSCGAILVFRFLFRPLAGAIRDALAAGGLLIYETFTIQQRNLGHGPVNENFLLREDELRAAFADLEILEYWEGLSSGARPEALARLSARKKPSK
jgi:SAM-dependent methyltransferase